MNVKFTKKFQKQYEKSPKGIKKAFEEKLDIFTSDKFYPTLNNHQLAGKLNGYRSINVTGDWRAVYRETDDFVLFELLGTHSQLYR